MVRALDESGCHAHNGGTVATPRKNGDGHARAATAAMPHSSRVAVQAYRTARADQGQRKKTVRVPEGSFPLAQQRSRPRWQGPQGHVSRQGRRAATGLGTTQLSARSGGRVRAKADRNARLGVPVPLGAPEAPPVGGRKGTGQRFVDGIHLPRIGLHSWNLPLSASFYTAPEAGGTEPQTASAHPTSGDLEPRLAKTRWTALPTAYAVELQSPGGGAVRAQNVCTEANVTGAKTSLS